MKKRLIVVIAFASIGTLAGVACSFPDVTFGTEDGSTSEADAPDGDSVVVVKDGAAPLDDGGRKDADAATRVDAAAVCPALCADAGVGKCDDAGTCTVTCGVDGTCIKPIVCPEGIPCVVSCTGAGTCTGHIDCQTASSCAKPSRSC